MMMDEENKPIIGISCGDLNGIGFEVIMKTFRNQQMMDFCTPVVFASSKVASYHRKALNVTDVNFHIINSFDQLKHHKPNLINTWKDAVNLEIGSDSREVGEFALKSLDAAISAFQDGRIDALVTAPVNKNNINSEAQPFSGHTGYIGDKVAGEPLMILTSKELKIALVTGHIALKDVSGQLSVDLIEQRINQLHDSLVQDFGISKPKIAVLGLNPHAGDNGLLGEEEEKIINPAIKRAFAAGKLVYGPYAADGYFGVETFSKFDATLAMYHDQGLIPFKALAFEEGVNYTAGLSIVRTSPDHGTGFPIAGKGIASETSFREAVFLACEVLKKRKEYQGLKANELQPQLQNGNKGNR
jgi:4-hydroxythreonine-4-phosphate dehydrogenase